LADCVTFQLKKTKIVLTKTDVSLTTTKTKSDKNAKVNKIN